MKIGVFPGSFNPPHKGHKMIFNYLIDNYIVDKVIVIPTGNYWNKNDLIDIKHRIKMLKYYENNQIIINDNLNDIPYTYLIMRELKRQYSDISFALIIGMDNLKRFHLWKNFKELLYNEIIVIPRKDYLYNASYNVKIIDKYLENDISSSMVRKLIEKNEINKLRAYLDDNVINYIVENKLYQKNN